MTPAAGPEGPPRSALSVVLLEGVHASAVEYLHAHGFPRVERLTGALDRAALHSAVRSAHLLGVRSRTRVDAAALAAAPELLALGAFCIGTSQLDLEAAAARGVPVFNAPHSNTRSVAELVLGYTILLLRDVHRKSVAAHAGRWLKGSTGSHEVRGKTLGIVGYGHIGSQVSVLAEGLGMRVLYYDVEVKLPLGNAQPTRALDELLPQCDVVTLHVPDTPLTRGMVGRREIALLRPGAKLVNTSRGTVVDLEALADALRAGHVGGAAVDVFPEEPATNDEPFRTPLQGLDNVLLSPHVAGSTVEAQEKIGVEVARKLAHYATRGATAGAVNFPQLALGEVRTACRVLHVHRNVPGVVRAINDILADAGLNVAGQVLDTHGEVGYVAVDVEGDPPPDLLERVRAVPATVRARVVT
jgi:D-3-phosphoglycerate dehydrogenase / 2-oxoglutarate reductase